MWLSSDMARSRCEALDSGWNQLVRARCFSCSVGERGTLPGGICFSNFGMPQSMVACKTCSCFEAVAIAIYMTPGALLFSEHIDACVTKSSEELMFTSSRLVSLNLLLFCEYRSLRVPLAVTATSALFPGLGWKGPKACTRVFSCLYEFCSRIAGP